MVFVSGLKIGALIYLLYIQSFHVQGKELPTCGDTFPSLQSTACRNIQTLAELKYVVDSGITSLVLCPGTIAKEDSNEFPLEVKNKLDMMCQVPNQCIFRGGGSYIDVMDLFSAHGIVFEGSTESAVTVRMGQSAAFCGCNFVRNGAPEEQHEQGGAIKSKMNAEVLVDSCLFEKNYAAEGGAIFNHDGWMRVVNSTFHRNRGTVTGGAILNTPLSTMEIMDCTFENNTATKGPAVYMRSGTIWSESGSLWRNNGDCDGVYVDKRGGCDRESISFPTLPTRNPTYAPTMSPSVNAESNNTESNPTSSPTTANPTESFVDIANTFELGKLVKDALTGLLISKGLEVRRLASSGTKIRFESTNATTQYSTRNFHFDPDGAVCLNTEDGGWAYVSNSENMRGPGGVYSLLFDKLGKTMDYIAVLENTRRNCAGGKTPWNTWISCEEWKRGQCFQCHPTKPSRNQTTLGELQGGNFEAFTYDDRNKADPVFFVTEDDPYGALRRFRPKKPVSDGPQILHGSGERTYLRIVNSTHFEWTSSLKLGRYSAKRHFPNTEGIDRRKDQLYFVSKVNKNVFTLNLDRKTYSKQVAGHKNNLFREQPDNIHAVGDDLLYVTEDGGKDPGVFVRDKSGSYYTLFMADDPKYYRDETTGVAFSPSMKTLYGCLQEHGDCFSFTRKDGRPFPGMTLNIRAHPERFWESQAINSLQDYLE